MCEDILQVMSLPSSSSSSSSSSSMVRRRGRGHLGEEEEGVGGGCSLINSRLPQMIQFKLVLLYIRDRHKAPRVHTVLTRPPDDNMNFSLLRKTS